MAPRNTRYIFNHYLPTSFGPIMTPRNTRYILNHFYQQYLVLLTMVPRINKVGAPVTAVSWGRQDVGRVWEGTVGRTPLIFADGYYAWATAGAKHKQLCVCVCLFAVAPQGRERFVGHWFCSSS